MERSPLCSQVERRVWKLGRLMGSLHAEDWSLLPVQGLTDRLVTSFSDIKLHHCYYVQTLQKVKTVVFYKKNKYI